MHQYMMQQVTPSNSTSASASPTASIADDPSTDEYLEESLIELMKSADELLFGSATSFEKGRELGNHFNDIRGISDNLPNRTLQRGWESWFAHHFGFIVEREANTLTGFVSAIDLASAHSFGHGSMPDATRERLHTRWFDALNRLGFPLPTDLPDCSAEAVEKDALVFHAEVLRKLTERSPGQPFLDDSGDSRCLGDFCGDRAGNQGELIQDA